MLLSNSHKAEWCRCQWKVKQPNFSLRLLLFSVWTDCCCKYIFSSSGCVLSPCFVVNLNVAVRCCSTLRLRGSSWKRLLCVGICTSQICVVGLCLTWAGVETSFVLFDWKQTMNVKHSLLISPETKCAETEFSSFIIVNLYKRISNRFFCKNSHKRTNESPCFTRRAGTWNSTEKWKILWHKGEQKPFGSFYPSTICRSPEAYG